MKKATIAILISAALLSVLLMVFDGFTNAPSENWVIEVFLNGSDIPDYYPDGFRESFDLPGQTLSVFNDVWNSYEHEDGSPFDDIVCNAILCYYDERYTPKASYWYNSETGHLARHVNLYTYALRFEGIKPVLYKKKKNVDFDIEAVKEFMIEHLIDALSVKAIDSYVYFRRNGDTVTVYDWS